MNKIIISDEVKNFRDSRKKLNNGDIVYCKGNSGTGNFYGIVYDCGILDLENGSNAYIYTNEPLHLGDTISYWTIEQKLEAQISITKVLESI